MATRCGGCAKDIYDIAFMECSNEKCKKLYHWQCIGISAEAFSTCTDEYKNNWICPECVCSKPKQNNKDTPVKGIVMNETFTPSSFVNTQRGNRFEATRMSTDNVDNEMLLRELREFRAEMNYRFSEQEKAYKSLEVRFMQVETELQFYKMIMGVAAEETNKNDSEKETINPVSVEKTSFANITKQKIKEVSAKKSGAMKSAKLQSKDMQTNDVEVLNTKVTLEIQENKIENVNDWKEVRRRKNRFPSNEVRKGGSTSSSEIHGTERKKFLHVWRLKKETTAENLEIYVKNKLGGAEVPIKIEKINHKTERDYASFRIGVPESVYEKLNQPELWPVNVEFCEWIWFRRSFDSSKK